MDAIRRLLIAIAALFAALPLSAVHAEEDGLLCGRAEFYANALEAAPGKAPPIKQYGRTRVADIISVRLELEFDFEKESFQGWATTRLAAINDGLDAIEFDCVDLDVQSVRSGGETLDFDYDGDVLFVRFPRQLREGEEVEVAVEYGKEKPRRGLHFISPSSAYPDRRAQVWSHGEPTGSRYWFPCYDFPNERTQTEIIATVEKSKTVLSNGRLLSVNDLDGGRRRFHWRQDKPHVHYLVTLVAGEFSIIEDDCNGLPVRYYVPEEEKDKAAATFGDTPAMLEFFERAIGVAYPWDQYAQAVVEDFIAGGMENTSATTMNRAILTDELNRIDSSANSIVAHELAHQWFGDLLTCRDWSHMWLNEGFATYFDWLWHEEAEGFDSFQWRRFNSMKSILAQETKPDVPPVVYNEYKHAGQMFSYRSYQKGAAILHMLRRELGDELWRKAVNRYTTDHSGAVVETNDLLRAIEEATGRNFEAFFEQWLYRGGAPKVRADCKWNDELKTAEITLDQTQAVDAAHPPFHFNLDIGFYNDDGRQVMRTVSVDESHEQFMIPLSAQPAFTRIDPNRDVLMDLTFDKKKPILLKQLKADPSSCGRVMAADALASQDESDAVEALGAALGGDAFWGVRIAAANALGKNGGDKAREILLAALESGQGDARVLGAIAAALGNFDGEGLIADLRDIAWDKHATSKVRASAVGAIAKIEADESESLLAKALAIDSQRQRVRSAAISGLRKIESVESLDEIQDLCKPGQAAEVRAEAMRAYGFLAMKSESEKKIVSAREFLLKALDAETTLSVRKAAIDGLGELGDEEAVKPLRKIADKGVEWRLKSSAESAITKIREAQDRDAEVAKLRSQMDKAETALEEMEGKFETLEERFDRLTERLSEDEGPE
jgi:aminopeptidase N